MNRNLVKYSLVIVLGLASALGLGSYLKAQRQERDKLVYLAKKNGYNVNDYVDSYHLTKEVEEKKSFAPDQWSQFKRYLNDPNPDFRMRNAAYLRFAKGTPFEAEARELVMQMMESDSNPYVRGTMLLTLERWNDPRWHELCEQKLKDPAEPVREMARGLLDGTARKKS